MRARHVRRGPGLVDEHELREIEIGLRFEPCATLAHDVRTVLLDRMTGLFPRHAVALEEAGQGRARRGDAARGQTGAQFLEALVAGLLERRHDVRMPRLDPPRPHVSALRLRLEAPRRPPLPGGSSRHRPRQVHALSGPSTVVCPSRRPWPPPRDQRVGNEQPWEFPSRLTTKGRRSDSEAPASRSAGSPKACWTHATYPCTHLKC